MAANPKRRPAGPVRIDRLARDCLGPAIARQGLGSAEILAAWGEIVGPGLATRTRPERIRWPRRRDEAAPGEAATLVVRAEGGDALEIQHMTGEILDRLNGFFGWRAVGRIAVRQAPVGDRPTAIEAPKPVPRTPEREIPGIADDGLRAALTRLGRGIAAATDNKT